MSENSKRNDHSTKKISLAEGRRLAIQIFDRQRPAPQKLTVDERERLKNVRAEIEALLKKVRSNKEKK
jgi:hypothetical protein